MRAHSALVTVIMLCGLVLAGPAAPPARAADAVKLAAFAGKWQGSAVSESDISSRFRLTSRDIDVEIRPTGDGFDLKWQTVQRQKGEPGNPEEVLKASSLSFVQVRPRLWRAIGNADPVESGAPYAWAHLSGQTLTVSSLQIYPDGRHEVQVYKRTLDGNGMQLEFTRAVEGEPVRTAKGRLVKVAE
ncbi:MAG TPA: hypothetical protein VE631_11235 [Alphaproteobacteria bacterium]|nr:hypothetical protein [Alphaproteobacteria bacterium]